VKNPSKGTLFIIAIIPGSAASMCILFNASEAGGFNCKQVTIKLINDQFKKFEA
jgi:hypothetical protein